MTLPEAIQIVTEFQDWRRGNDAPMIDPRTMGIAIDVLLQAVKVRGEG